MWFGRGRVGVFGMGGMRKWGCFFSIWMGYLAAEFDFDVAINRMYRVNVYLYLSSGS
jgi:hypothetical protein